MALTKVKTGSVGPGGETIFDVFSGTEHIKDPSDPRLAGVDIAGLAEGVVPTGFQSQFQPFNVEVKDEVPNAALEGGVTRADILKMFQENQAAIQKRYDDQVAAMAPTQGELERQQRLTALKEAQTRAVEDVEERPLTGTILRGGLESEIANIKAGRTVASLPNLREQRLLTLQLGNDLAARQIKVDQAKIALESAQDDRASFEKYQQSIMDFDEKTQERNDKLPERQKSLVDSVVTQYAGLEWNDLDSATQKSLTDLAGKLGISVQALQTNLKNQKNKIELDVANQRSLIAQRVGGGTDGGVVGDVLGTIPTITGKPRTDIQNTALGYAQRMQDADAVINELGRQFTGITSYIGQLAPNALKS